MIQVSIPVVTIRNMAGVGKTSGKAYNLDFQTVYVHTIGADGKPAPFPEKVEIILDRDPQTGASKQFAAGVYQLRPDSIYVDRDGKLAVAPRLQAVQARS